MTTTTMLREAGWGLVAIALNFLGAFVVVGLFAIVWWLTK